MRALGGPAVAAAVLLAGCSFPTSSGDDDAAPDVVAVSPLPDPRPATDPGVADDPVPADDPIPDADPIPVAEPSVVAALPVGGPPAEAAVEAPDVDQHDVDRVVADCPERHPGEACPGPIDDANSARHPAAEIDPARVVKTQQRKLNRLFDGYGIDPLEVDGISGPVTRQRLCAFRLSAGLPVSTADMRPGSEEERVLMGTKRLAIPETSATQSRRWILIDQTCQMMFVGRGADDLHFVFPTSTGQAAFPTRLQDRTPAYRYNPASANGGWHNSTTYPASNDNPLNGNMYRPLYFDGGQAIHGANNVPRSPASHGCARLRTWHQDELLSWLGLGGSGYTTDRGRIGVTVNIQGRWQG